MTTTRFGTISRNVEGKNPARYPGASAVAPRAARRRSDETTIRPLGKAGGLQKEKVERELGSPRNQEEGSNMFCASCLNHSRMVPGAGFDVIRAREKVPSAT